MQQWLLVVYRSEYGTVVRVSRVVRKVINIFASRNHTTVGLFLLAFWNGLCTTKTKSVHEIHLVHAVESGHSAPPEKDNNHPNYCDSGNKEGEQHQGQ